jgi:Ubiquitin fusion degradation protein UFD1
MAAIPDTLKWSAHLHVAQTSRTPRLQGDKITLPQSALEALLAAAPIVDVQNGNNRTLTSTYDPFNPYTFAAERYAREQISDRQQQLPHPLTFRIVNSHNGRVVYAGIREFSAEEDEIGLSTFLQEALGLNEGSSPPSKSPSPTPNGDVQMTNDNASKQLSVTVHAKQLPKGTYVRLRPLEAGYDPEDWKSLLERYLRDNFTTLTNGEILAVPGAKYEQFRFLVDKLEPEGDAVCIVDTDLEVDIEALNEEQARETLNRKLAKKQRAPGTAEGSSPGGWANVGQKLQGQVRPGEYVDYELKEWDRSQYLNLKVESQLDEAPVDIFVSPFSTHQRSKPRQDEHVLGDMDGHVTKRLRLSPTNVDFEEAESLYISVQAYKAGDGSDGAPIPYILSISTASKDVPEANEAAPLVDDQVVCKNCHQHIPKRTLHLHEAFCYRNNVFCPKCSNVFLKNSEAWKTHWHCSHEDGAYGGGEMSQSKHNTIFHPSSPLQCPACDFQAFNVPILAQHRTTTCPGKEILCQFCHLVVPQQGPDDPSFNDAEVLMSGLTPHELTDGARTTECHMCNKIVRLRDMKMHLRIHDRERVLKPKPRLCVNKVCGRTIKASDERRIIHEQLGLCSECFGPLYVANHDPEGKALRRRIERRLLTQLVGGCGKSWCRNEEWCKTGHKNVNSAERVLTTKDASVLVKPVLDQLPKGDGSGLRFCVDEASQQRRLLGKMLASGDEHELEWCVKALEETHNDLGAATEWLSSRAPKRGEVLQ